ncbi:putative membrane protein (plasmid) [Bacillus cereus]|nr:putative membrane protein [Bacillus cereus]AJI02641.1 putative membrane protein [Bacillus cereus G9241]
MMEESTFSHLMILVIVILTAGFIHLMDWIDRKYIKEEQK